MTIRKSLVYSYLDRYASLAVTIVSSMIIARLLTPADIGVYSITIVLLSYLASVRDMGVGGYLVQEKDLTVDRVAAVWAVYLGLGLFLALVIFIASKPVASFYNEPQMRDIMLLISINYAVNPFGSLTYAWQIREMRFGALAVVRFSATLTGAIVSAYFAWRGMGPISLALGSLGSTLVNAMMAVYFRPKWFPWLPRIKELRRVLAFGSRSTGSTLLQTIGGSAPELLLGKLQNMTAVGLYSRASGLVSMFTQLVLAGISSVAISWFAKQSRDYGNISQAFMKSTSYVAAVGWAFALCLIFLAHPAICLLYGDQWTGAVDATRLMAVALACGMPAALSYGALMALGAAQQVLRVTIITTMFGVILAVLGASAGLLYIAAFQVVGAIVSTWLWLRTVHHEVQFEWREFMYRLRESAAVGIAAGIAPALVFVLYGPHPENIWLPLVIGVPGSVAGFLAAIILLKHPLLEELQSIIGKFKLNS